MRFLVLVYMLLFLGSAQAQYLRIEPNAGRYPNQVQAYTKLSQGNIFWENDRILFQYFHPNDLAQFNHAHAHSMEEEPKHFEGVRYHAFSITPLAAQPLSCILENSLAGTTHYFQGNDPSKWQSNVKAYSTVFLPNVWKGIHMSYSTLRGNPYYSIEVEAGVNPNLIRLQYDGVEDIRVEENKLKIELSVNSIREEGLAAYQIIANDTQWLEVEYVLDHTNLGFNFPKGFNSEYAIIIDPRIVASTYSGAAIDNFGYTATYSANGSMYAGGAAFGAGYPITVGRGYAGGGLSDIVISRFSSNGRDLEYSTYLGGTGTDIPVSIIENSKGELVILGVTGSSNYPVSDNAVQKAFLRGTSADVSSNGANFTNGSDLIITILSPNGEQIVGSTYFGGNGNDGINFFGTGNLYYNYNDVFRGEVVLDDFDNIYFTSTTRSESLPAARNAFNGMQDGFYAKLNPDCSTVFFSQYIGSTQIDAAYAIKLATDGSFYIVGSTNGNNLPLTNNTLIPSFKGGRADGFLAKIDASGTLESCTYLGGTGNDQAYFVDLDNQGNVYVFGIVEGNALPQTAGVTGNSNAGQYVLSIKPDLKSVNFISRYGKGDGDSDISPTAFLVDECGNIYCVGYGGTTNNRTRDPNDQEDTKNLPVTSDAPFKTTDGSDFHFYVMSPNAQSVQFATYFGGSNSPDHVDGGTSRFDKRGIVYHTICASCGGVDNDLPTTLGAYSTRNGSDNCNIAIFKFEFDNLVAADLVNFPGNSGCVPFEVQFQDNSTGGQTYEWDFGDGNRTLVKNPVHTFTTPGVYNVRLIVTDPSKCNLKDTTYTIINVEPPPAALKPFITTQSFCDFLLLRATASPPPGASIKYIVDGEEINSSTIIRELTAQGPHTVRMQTTFTEPCFAVTFFDTIVVFNSTRLTIQVSDSLRRDCDTLRYDAQILNTSTASTKIRWDFTGGTSNSRTLKLRYFDPGQKQIRLIMSDTGSCNKSDTIEYLVQYSKVPLEFELDYSTKNTCDSFYVFAEVITNSKFETQWTWGDGSQSFGNTIEYAYTVPNSYTAVVFLNDTELCESPAIASIPIDFDSTRFQIGVTVSPEFFCSDIRLNGIATNGMLTTWILNSTIREVAIQFDTLVPFADTVRFISIQTDSNFCNISDTQVVEYISGDILVFAEFNIQDSAPYFIGTPVQLINLSRNAKRYNWTFGDNTSSEESDPLHYYKRLGTYDICLVAISEFVCNDTICKTLLVENGGNIDIPNAFSPDDDGINDVFRIRHFGGKEFLLRVYNRFGELVFESRDPKIGWDGTFRGKPQEMEVYAFTLRGVLNNGEDIFRKGNVTLVR